MTATLTNDQEIYGAFLLTLKNPCIDPDYYEFITVVDMPDYTDYYLYENAPDGVLIESNSLVKIVTKPNETDLCMEGIEYSIVWQEETVTEDTWPVALVSADLDAVIVRLYTEDESYVGLSNLNVLATLRWYPWEPPRFTVYPGSAYVDNPLAARTVIEILAECINPFELIAKG